MIHAPDGKLRFSPSDLVSYLEGDFAAWCDRMLAERGRARGAGPAELAWATPDEDEELDLAARKGLEHEQRWLVGLRELTAITGFAEDAAAAALDELEWSRWLMADARGYAFVARIVRDVIVRDMLTPGERRRIEEHRQRSGHHDQGTPS
jgi:hypothetical protein